MPGEVHEVPRICLCLVLTLLFQYGEECHLCFGTLYGNCPAIQQKPMTQELFYRDLMNVKLDQSWEIITFREFIL